MITTLQAFAIVSSVVLWASTRALMREVVKDTHRESFFMVVALIPVGGVWFVSFALAHLVTEASKL